MWPATYSLRWRTSTIVGKADKPGVLTVGTLLPAAGKWKLFLQTKINGKVVTVPYTLNVA